MRPRLLLIAVAFATLALPTASPATSDPTAPSGLTAIALAGDVQLNWQPVAGASGYVVYRGTDPTAVTTALTNSGGTSGTSFDDASAANGTTYYYVVHAIVGGVESGDSVTVSGAPQARSCTSANPVVQENCYPGSDRWVITNPNDVASGGLEVYATSSSINHGDSIALKVNAPAGAPYHIELYRSGYYGGRGGRPISRIEGLTGISQPACASDATTGLIDCSNWTTSASITTSVDWPAGVYVVRVARDDNGMDTQTAFVVRNDARSTPLTYTVPFATYEAYNAYGGKSLYDFNSTGATTVAGTARAVKVSFDRPYLQPLVGPYRERNWYPTTDFSWVSWLEQQGYDVSYLADTDLESNPNRLLTTNAVISGVHDEYYSAGMRGALQNARDAGVSLFFAGGNAVYWKTRYENNPVSGVPNRVLVCYKTTQSGAADPVAPTTTWRDPNGANSPENGLIGQMYAGDNDNQFFPLVVSAAEGSDRVWRNTPLANQAPGTSTSLGTSLVGWEWDARSSNGAEPSGTKTVATSPVSGSLIQNFGKNTTAGSTNVTATKYIAASRALVFSTGTNYWSRGLALNANDVGEPNAQIQQTTVNVLSDMGVTPATPATGIVVDSSPPGAPAGVTGQSPSQTTVSLAWNPVAGADAYDVYRTNAPRGQGNLGTRVNTMPIYGTSLTDTGLSPSTDYYYVVVALGGSLRSAPSAEVRVTTQSPPQFVIASRSPADGAAGVSPAATIRVNFNRAADPATLTSSSFSLTDANGNSVPGSISYDSGLFQAQLSPAAALTVGATYTVRMGGSVAAAGDETAMGNAATWSFTVATSAPAPPTVASTSPAQSAALVGRGTVVQATFSRGLDPSSVTTGSFSLTNDSGNQVSASVSYDAGSRTLTLTPDAPLGKVAGYTARLAPTLAAGDGTPLGTAYTWSFSTAACPCNLFPSDPVPAKVNVPVQDGRTGAGPWSYELGVKIKVDEPMLLTAVRFYKSAQETGVHTAKVWSATGTLLAQTNYSNETGSGWQRVVLPNPLSLAANTTYVVSVNANTVYAATVNGLSTQVIAGPLRTVADGKNGVFGSSAGAFPNQTSRSTDYGIDAEVTLGGTPAPPTVTTTAPAANATGVLRDATIKATFSRPVDPATLSSATFTVSGPSGPVGGSVTYDDSSNTATFTPSVPLAYSTRFTAVVGAGVRARDGMPLGTPTSWSFTVADPVPPTVTLVVPAAGASDVGPSTTPRADFSKPLDPSTLSSSTFTLTGPTGPVAGTVSYSAATMAATFAPSAPLFPGTYTARLDPAITAADQATLSTAYSWSFTVVSAPPAFSVASTTPTGSSEARTVVPRVVFNRSVDPDTLTSSALTLAVQGGANVPATVSYDASSLTASLTPLSPLAYGTTYVATLAGSVKAADGSSLAGPTSWSFTTASCPCSLFSVLSSPSSKGNPVRDGRSGSGPWSYELGIKITVSSPVSLTAIRYYKDSKETGSHTGTVWTAGGAKLASVPFTGETGSGWQTQSLASPLQLQPNVVYVISVNANAYFGTTAYGLQSQLMAGPLKSVADGLNGVFGSAAGVFPNQSYHSSNYFVDGVVQ